jgi:hypothetical protein
VRRVCAIEGPGIVIVVLCAARGVICRNSAMRKDVDGVQWGKSRSTTRVMRLKVVTPICLWPRCYKEASNQGSDRVRLQSEETPTSTSTRVKGRSGSLVDDGMIVIGKDSCSRV